MEHYSSNFSLKRSNSFGNKIVRFTTMEADALGLRHFGICATCKHFFETKPVNIRH